MDKDVRLGTSGNKSCVRGTRHSSVSQERDGTAGRSEIKRQTAGRGQMPPAGHLQKHGSSTDSVRYQVLFFPLERSDIVCGWCCILCR